MKFFGDLENVESTGIITEFYDKSIPIPQRIRNLYSYLENNRFYIYLYGTSSKCIGKYPAEVKRSVLPQDGLTVENMQGVKFVDFFVNLDAGQVVDLSRKSPTFNKITIFMCDSKGRLKGVFKTITLDTPREIITGNPLTVKARIELWR